MYLQPGDDSFVLPTIPDGNPNAIPRGIPHSAVERGDLYDTIEVGVASAIAESDRKYPRVGDGRGKVSRQKRQSAFSVLNFLLVVFNIILDINNNGKRSGYCIRDGSKNYETFSEQQQ